MSYSFSWEWDKYHPLLMIDVYKTKFSFMTVEHPRIEKGLTFTISLFRFKILLNFYKEYPVIRNAKWH